MPAADDMELTKKHFSLCLLVLGCELLLFHVRTSQARGCPHGRVRLVNGGNSRQGRVTICLHGTWNTVCDYGYGFEGVICRQLSFSRQGAVALYQHQFGRGEGAILEEADCTGSEMKLIECDLCDWPDYNIRSRSYCTHADDVGVRCLPCQTGEIELLGGISEYNGRVEICVNGVWGTVCDDAWDASDSNVVCRQLGYSRYGSSAYGRASYGPGGLGLPIHLDNVRCTGNEQRLINCPYTNNSRGQDCTHSEDASIKCRPTLLCEKGDLRLAQKTVGKDHEGLVEICIDEAWHKVCADSSWGDEEASVTCRELGYSAGGQATIRHGLGFSYIIGVACSGRERKLINCRYVGPSSTPTCHLLAGVTCSIETLPVPTNFQITVNESNICILKWQPPANLSTAHGTISHYVTNCTNSELGLEECDNSTQTFQMFSLQPYLLYECCVLAVNEAGYGNSSCQMIFTNEAAPTGPPTDIEALQFNSTSVLLTWRPPAVEHRNGVIRHYYVELTEDNVNETSSQEYSTESPYSLIGGLQPNVTYMFRVAAFTVDKGPLSERSMIVLDDINIDEELLVDLGTKVESTRSHFNPGLAITSGLLALTVIASGTCFTVQLCYKLKTGKKRRPVQDRSVYATVEAPQREVVESETNLDRTFSKQDQLTGYSHDSPTPPIPSRGYSLSPSLEKLDNIRNLELQEWTKKVSSRSAVVASTEGRENTYQPLAIPPRCLTDDQGEYQCLTEHQAAMVDESGNEDLYCEMS